MSIRNDQLPPTLATLPELVAGLRRELSELRAALPDLSAACGLLPPLDADLTRWPQTSLTSWTTIAQASNIRWKSKLRLSLLTATSGGGAGNVRVLVDGAPWGPTVVAGAALDYTGPLPAATPLGGQYLLAVQAQRTSGAGTVHAQVQLINSLP